VTTTERIAKARETAHEAANQHMRAAGRTRWSAADFGIAVEEYERLTAIVPKRDRPADCECGEAPDHRAVCCGPCWNARR
jgi:hypothetical protein